MMGGDGLNGECKTCCFFDCCDRMVSWKKVCVYYAPCGNTEIEQPDGSERWFREFLDAWYEYVREYE